VSLTCTSNSLFSNEQLILNLFISQSFATFATRKKFAETDIVLLIDLQYKSATQQAMP